MSVTGVLLTGFPGFIAGRLLERLIPHYGKGTQWYFLVEPRFAGAAEERCKALAAQFPEFAKHWHVLPGDIRKPDLGLGAADLTTVRKKVNYVWHLAAIYNLAVPLPVAYAVNVDGTIHVLDLCESLDKLETLFYISTCYVAGLRTGRVYEDQLDEGQDFKNHYESTKFWAEKHVWRRRDKIPTVIFRPAIVVGDHESGETNKGDGPYYIMRLLLDLPTWLPGVHLGPATAKVNLVPVSWLIDAMAKIAADGRAVGKVFQLADPDPLTARQIMERMSEITGHGKPRITVPRAVILRLLKSRRVQKLLGIPFQSFAYLDHPVDFDTKNTTTLLADGGTPCPRLSEYMPNLVTYAKSHPEIFAG